MKRESLSGLLACVPLMTACSIGEGEGDVRSEQLFVKDCWNGPFDLDPNFFAANPFEDTMMIRLQRGEQAVETSDGVVLVVNEVKSIRTTQLGTRIPLGLPAGVSPPGLPEQLNLNPAQVSLSLYLHETCHVQNAALYAVDGWIEFQSLFSGDRNEDRADDRLTEATFEAVVVDPRDVTLEGGSSPAAGDPSLPPMVGYPEGSTSTVTGSFRFYFQRGIPAQPFP